MDYCSVNLWRILLESAASCKSAPTYYNITQFVNNQVEEKIVVGGNGAQQVVLKSGPRKPKLEKVTLAQWSVANLAILYRPVSETACWQRSGLPVVHDKNMSTGTAVYPCVSFTVRQGVQTVAS